MKKITRIMEFFWLAVAILSLVGAGYYIYTLGWAEGWIYLMFPLVASMMWAWRRGMRSRIDRWSEGQQ